LDETPAARFARSSGITESARARSLELIAINIAHRLSSAAEPGRFRKGPPVVTTILTVTLCRDLLSGKLKDS
jgi:hypothetical protein